MAIQSMYYRLSKKKTSLKLKNVLMRYLSVKKEKCTPKYGTFSNAEYLSKKIYEVIVDPKNVFIEIER